MEFVVEGIRKAVILVLLMEVVAQLQAGKEYEKLFKMLTGLMVVYSLATVVIGFFSEESILEPLESFFLESTDFISIDDTLWELEYEDQMQDEGRTADSIENISIPERSVTVTIPEIQIEEIHTTIREQ